MIHLHVHSNFSFLDGASPPERLAQRAAELGMPALALTDHDGLYGAVRFLQAAVAYNIKPIIGLEVVVGGTGLLPGAADAGRYHLVLLAENRAGYSSLSRIVTRAQLDHQDDPWISLDDLSRLTQGVIALSGCARGEVASALRHDGERGGSTASALDDAVRVAQRYREIFGRKSFGIELEHHLLPGDDLRAAQLVEVARRARLGVVIANDVHYARPEEYRLRDVMACIHTNTPVDVWTERRQRNAEYYLKTEEEVRRAFRALPDAVVTAGLRAGEAIAARCDVLEGSESLLASASRPPHVEIPDGETAFSHLYTLCDRGMRKRYRPLRPEVIKRLAYELNVVERMELAEFFLCIWDIVEFSREQGIRCAGRGSAADSIIAYVLGITSVDPIAHNLLFDRFLNPGRVGMPDVDIDFDSRRRDEVIAYIENKYGSEHSAMVANLVTYRSRSAFRDVAKAMGFPPGLIDHCAAALSYRSVTHIREDLALAGIEDRPMPSGEAPSPERSGGSVQRVGQLETIIELCEQLDGYPRHLSLHNGGMLITREPLVDVVPIELATSGVRVCQFNKDDVEALGLIKFDILGLRTLSIVDESVKLIKETRGVDLPIDDLRLDDPATFDLICTSKTIGVFQIESPGQWHLLQRAQPRTFGDLIIQIALFRPGPLQGGMVYPYIERRCGREPVTYMHPSLEDALRDTLGVVIFQEQVLQVAHDFAGLSYAEADGLRRAMSHYRTDAEMDTCRVAFVESAVSLGRDRALAEEMYHTITYFSGYGFCRSHAAAFAKTVYQTAYLKTHYPAELLAGILSNEPCCYYPTQTVIEDAKKWGIEVLPVDINRSRSRYHVDAGGPSRAASRTIPAHIAAHRKGAIRMGFLQVKGLSEETADGIVAARKAGPFRNLADFWRRTAVDRDVTQHLIAVGAFDSLGVSRRKLLWQLDEVMRKTPRIQPLGPAPIRFSADRSRGRFAGHTRGPVSPETGVWVAELDRGGWEPLPDLPELTELDLAGLDMTLQNASAEYSVMSFYRRSLKAAGVLSLGDLELKPHGAWVRTAGIVVSRQRPPTANGMTFLVLSDEEGELPVAVHPPVYDAYRRVINSSASLVLEGTVQRTRRHISLVAKKAWPLQKVAALDQTPYRRAEDEGQREAGIA
jgi:error-prone DNA polymerase